jgi:hypothetical protein
MLETKQPIFIIGSPRSGTTMLQVLLSNHPRMASSAELTVFDGYLAPWISTWEREARDIKEKSWGVGMPMMWNREDFDAMAKTFLERTYGKMVERVAGATHFLDKNPAYSVHTDTIKRYLPRAKFIHMIRDGRDVACSLVAAKRSMDFGFETHMEAGNLWRSMVTAARSAAKFGQDYIELRYEDFLADNNRAYRAALDFCGLPYDETWLAETIAANSFDKMKARQATGDKDVKVSRHHYRTGKAGNWESEFGSRERYEFELTAGPLLRELGYASEGWWARNGWERFSIPFMHRQRRRAGAIRLAIRWACSAVTLRGMKQLRGQGI